MSSLPVALQMYTVRDHSAEDFAGTMKQVAAMGYDGVELAGTGGLSADQLSDLLAECGLKCFGGHVGLDALEGDLDGSVAYYKQLGTPWITIPYLAENLRGDAAAWKALGKRMAELGQGVKDGGLQLCYHNHAFEFDVKEGDQYGFDLLYASASADLLQCEIDTYWVQFAGQSAADYVAKYKDRAPLIHIKDMTAGDNPTFAEVGTGVMDFPSIFKAAEGGIAAVWIVEQDRCAGDSMEAAKLSHDNIRKLLA